MKVEVSNDNGKPNGIEYSKLVPSNVSSVLHTSILILPGPIVVIYNLLFVPLVIEIAILNISKSPK